MPRVCGDGPEPHELSTSVTHRTQELRQASRRGSLSQSVSQSAVTHESRTPWIPPGTGSRNWTYMSA
jgi:hypothetical protein